MKPRFIYYDLKLSPPVVLEMISPGYREIALLRRRLPKLDEQYHSSDFLKHQRMHLYTLFEDCPDRGMFGIACDVRPVAWEEDRRPNPTYETRHSNNSGDDRVERWLFAVHSVLFEIEASGMSDDDYVLLLMSGKISLDREKVGRGYSDLPAAWARLCSTTR